MQIDPSAWIDVGAADELAARPLQQVSLGRKKIALICKDDQFSACLLYTSPSPRDRTRSRMPSSA